MRALASLFCLVLLAACASVPPQVQSCDKLVALDDTKMLCWWPTNYLSDGYLGFIYEDGKLTPAWNKPYIPRSEMANGESYRIENAHIWSLAATTYKKREKPDVPPATIIAFYNTYKDMDSQKVYFCKEGMDNELSLSHCDVPADGNYKTEVGTEFKVENGFLYDDCDTCGACSYVQWENYTPDGDHRMQDRLDCEDFD